MADLLRENGGALQILCRYKKTPHQARFLVIQVMRLAFSRIRCW